MHITSSRFWMAQMVFCSGSDDVEDNDLFGRPITHLTNKNIERIDKIIR